MSAPLTAPSLTSPAQATPSQAARVWQFEAFDTLFFRESRPFDSIGGAQLASQFPPPARTLAGAIRTAIGEAHGVDWQRFNTDKSTYAELRAQIGDATGYGQLKLDGPFLLKRGERLFPAPLLLLEKDGAFVRLTPGDDMLMTDLGRVRLPQLQSPLPGGKALENVWLTRAGLEKVLSGGVPDGVPDVYRARDLFSNEERLGIGRDNTRRANVESLLYQTRHIRPREDVTLGIQVDGIDAKYHPAYGAVRLGGEGRCATFSVSPKLPISPMRPSAASQRILVVLLTPAGYERGWRPAASSFPKSSNVSLELVSAVLGKAVREGGWDMAENRPRALRSLVPAGSCYFYEAQGDAPAIDAQAELLQQHRVGLETELGHGEIAVGYW